MSGFWGTCSLLIDLIRGVRRLNVRNWEKAVADGNVEQMFGMNIKQEGIEVLGDQVSQLNSTYSKSSKLTQANRMLSHAGLTSGVVLWNSFTTRLQARRPRTSRMSPMKTALLGVIPMSRHPCGASVRSSTSSPEKERKTSCSCIPRAVTAGNIMGASLSMPG